jgi:hypothetical protein
VKFEIQNPLIFRVSLAVALNYQKEDSANFYNLSFFKNNGSCGYVLKPTFLRDPAIRYNPREKSHRDRGISLNLKLISGQHIPKAAGNSEVIDPYVEVKVSHYTSTHYYNFLSKTTTFIIRKLVTLMSVEMKPLDIYTPSLINEYETNPIVVSFYNRTPHRPHHT